MNTRSIRCGAALLAALLATPAGAQLVISEFRVRGPNGANDEFIELENNTATAHTVAGAGTGYAVVASDGVTRGVVPNGTVIPPGGHYLLVNAMAYSLASYPAGNSGTAMGDATYTADIPDNAGIALFNTDVAADFVLANRLDAVGSTSEANPLYKEGTGYPALTPFSIDYAFVRDACGKRGSITAFEPCAANGVALDSNNNATDFVFVDTNGTSAGAGQRLGAPGPQNLSSPISGSGTVAQAFDSCVSGASPPNRVRDFTSDPPNNSTFGTLDLRHTFTNTTGVNLTRLRFRIVDLTTFPAPSGFADLRPRTSTAVVVSVDRPPCGSGTSNITVMGTTLEQPPSQPNGSGFNGSLSAGTVTQATPLAPGASIDLRFLIGVQQNGRYKFGIVPEGLPNAGDGQVLLFEDCTDNCPKTTAITRAGATNPTAAATVDFNVTFSESMDGVDATDFAVATTGTLTGAAVATVSGSGSSRTVTVDTGNGEGLLRLDLINDASIVTSGNLIPLHGNFTTGEAYDVDRAAPALTLEQAATQADPASASPIDFTVTFSEAVTDFDATDVILGGSAGASAAAVSGGPTVFNVAVSGMTASGTVTASIAAGAASDALGNPSTASTSDDNTVTLAATAPSAPSALSAVSGEGQATLSFVLPANEGGLPILGYSAVCESTSGTVEANGSGSPIIVTGLANGVHYDCAVLAFNSVGDGPLSNIVAVFPQSVPGAPVVLAAVAGDLQATVYFAAPASDGGSPILSYAVLCADGLGTEQATGTSSPITVPDLRNFTTYSCVVLAHNAFGDGPPSAAIAVTPPANVLHQDGFESSDTF